MTDQPFAISVTDLAHLRETSQDHVLLDVREPWEAEICAIAGSAHVPLATLAGRVDDLPRDRPIVALCHHGARSARATAFLRSQGFAAAVNLEGGIDAWALQIDRTMARYD